MPVNLTEPLPQDLPPVAGVTMASASAGIRSRGGDDVLVMQFAEGTQCAAVFTRNRFSAAPVILGREHVQRDAGGIRALLVNAGNANAGNGEAGLAAARRTCEALAAELACSPQGIFPMSTGVILEPLPVAKITAVLPKICQSQQADGWLSAARAIMTTDTLPKAVSRTVSVNGQTAVVSGITKGAGMIRPDMGTMLCVIATDAGVPATLLDQWLRESTDASFNRITVDGDTSTNDTVLLAATGAGGVTIESPESEGAESLRRAISEVSLALAQAIIRDAEGATKFVTIAVNGAASVHEASSVAYTVAHSPLVKTAFFASDPNLGRLLMAIGNADINDLDPGKVDLYLDEVLVVKAGGRDPGYQEADGQRVLNQAEFSVTINLNRGTQQTTVWTSDLSHDYVSINADYRS
ncbi:MAG: bifunctional glutamate N-acetyltransferase/amino-acid acetyltransferase ArgJ [Burkholderiaceae bacterium]